jgi:hypothetical protein
LALAIGGIVTNDLSGILFRRLKLTQRTTRSSVWSDVFHERGRVLEVELGDGRRIIGWLRWLGSITTREETAWRQLGTTHQLVGCAASPDDCSLALRGLKTLAVRLKAIGDAALTLAHWLSERPEIERVLHPALPSCPGHEFWKRDFTGSTGVFSIVFQPRFSKAQVQGFVDKLELFEIGYSWAG